MKKQIILLAMMLLPMVGSAEKVEIDGIYYNLISKGNVAEVTSNPSKYKNVIDIPPSVTYNGVEYSVTSIGENAFENCSYLRLVTIPNSVNTMSLFNKCHRPIVLSA